MRIKRANTTPIYINTVIPPLPPVRFKWIKRLLGLCVVLVLVSTAVYQYVTHVITPPPAFPLKTELVIPDGATMVTITELLHEQGYIRSPFAMYVLLGLFYEPRDLKASTYIFSSPLSMVQLAERLLIGDYGNDLVRFVHYEGESRKHIAKRASEILDSFDGEVFMKLTEGQEGKLFPDTYLLPKVYSAKELADLLYTTYESRVLPLRPAILDSALTEDQVIILASILEREANSPESKKIVSGILQRRLALDMPLQVDASVEYVLDKPLNELTPADLKEDSPYNTYLNKGLPPTAIGNPGLTAIQAVLEPTTTTYLFYITGNDGKFYYSETYAAHKRNVDLYLRN